MCWVWKKDNIISEKQKSKTETATEKGKRDWHRVGAVGTTAPKKVPHSKLISYARGDKSNHKVQQHRQIRAMRVRATITITITIPITMTMTMTINQYAYCNDIVRVVRIGSHQKKRNYVEIKANAVRMPNWHLASCPNYCVIHSEKKTVLKLSFNQLGSSIFSS